MLEPSIDLCRNMWEYCHFMQFFLLIPSRLPMMPMYFVYFRKLAAPTDSKKHQQLQHFEDHLRLKPLQTAGDRPRCSPGRLFPSASLELWGLELRRTGFRCCCLAAFRLFLIQMWVSKIAIRPPDLAFFRNPMVGGIPNLGKGQNSFKLNQKVCEAWLSCVSSCAVAGPLPWWMEVTWSYHKPAWTWTLILWMEEILHHLGWLKPYKWWDKPSVGARFLPSTVCLLSAPHLWVSGRPMALDPLDAEPVASALEGGEHSAKRPSLKTNN